MKNITYFIEKNKSELIDSGFLLNLEEYHAYKEYLGIHIYITEFSMKELGIFNINSVVIYFKGGDDNILLNKRYTYNFFSPKFKKINNFIIKTVSRLSDNITN